MSDVSTGRAEVLQGWLDGNHPIGWLALINADIAPLNTGNNINRLSQAPTHRVSDHCQHANQGQGADGEGQSR